RRVASPRFHLPAHQNKVRRPLHFLFPEKRHDELARSTGQSDRNPTDSAEQRDGSERERCRSSGASINRCFYSRAGTDVLHISGGMAAPWNAVGRIHFLQTPFARSP